MSDDFDWDAEASNYRRTVTKRTTEDPVASPATPIRPPPPAEVKSPSSPPAPPRPPPPPPPPESKDSDDDDDDDTDDDTGDEGEDDHEVEEDDEEDERGWGEFTDEKGVKLWYNSKTGEVSVGVHPEHKFRDDGDKLADLGPGGKKEAMTLAKAITMLSLMEKQIDLIVDYSKDVAPAIYEDLKEVRGKLAMVNSALENTADAAGDERSDVDALVDWDKDWVWDNKHVAYYRAAASKVPHHEYEFKDWHVPQYFSDLPLPPDSKSITCVVRLPPMEQSSKEPVMTHTRISVTEADTAHKAIAQCLSKFKGLGDPADFVLKATGLRDFMFGDTPLYNYEHVRKCLRDGVDLKLSLVKRPPPLPPCESKARAEYAAKVNPGVEVVTPETHRNLSTRGPWEELTALPVSELRDLPFRVRIIGLDNVTPACLPRLDPLITQIYVRVVLFAGAQKIEESDKRTSPIALTENPRWMQWLMQDYCKETLVNQLPRPTKVCFMLVGTKEAEKGQEHVLGWATRQLIDEQGRLAAGEEVLRLWGVPVNLVKKHGAKKRELDPTFFFRAVNTDNRSTGEATLLRVKFDDYALPVVSPLVDKYREPSPMAVGHEIALKTLHKTQQKRLEELIESDPLTVLTADDKKLLWDMRHALVKYPAVLPKFLQCVHWGKQDAKFEAHRLLRLWAAPTSTALALELLDVKHSDYVVREYAVNHLKKLKDDELKLYLLQLTQCIKFEPYHDSPLVRFLIERSIRDPIDIGHFFFWHLKNEMATNPPFCERYAVIMEELLANCPRLAADLRQQNQAVLKLQRVAEMIVKLKREHGYSDDEAMKEYRKEIEKLNAYFFGPLGKFSIPLNPRIEATTLIVDKCRYMSSKMVPLWLVFQNADDDAPPVYVIFKSGDDLRQDILTLQMLQIMDRLWLSAGLDMKLTPYRVLATGVDDKGEGVGMIEVVLNSDTTSGIQLEYGGGAMGALKLDPLDLFLHDHNKGKALYDKAVQNFIASCAGYCVATFVLGIGDRHNGNIMVTKDGHLFHIDFGHFLGNFKKKFGVNRERAAFVFTPEMAFVMGGKKYTKSDLFKKFLQLCTNSFKTLRQHALVLENMFILMVAAQMPELMAEEDIQYMRDKLFLDLNEKKADKKLHSEINKSLDSTYRRIDNMIHNFKHG